MSAIKLKSFQFQMEEALVFLLSLAPDKEKQTCMWVETRDDESLLGMCACVLWERNYSTIGPNSLLHPYICYELITTRLHTQQTRTRV